MKLINFTDFRLNPQSKVFYYLPWILLVPALVLNIDLNPLIADEPIRALVALEMHLSDNIWIPSMNGEFYYNKPPLFNWIILLFFRLFNSFDEWVIRIPTVLSLIFFGISIYLITKKYLSHRIAFLITFATLTSGRILFYDSFLGLIDCLFSLVIFLLFMAVYHYAGKQNWLNMYLLMYFMTGVAFMLKGLPAPVFAGLTVIAVLYSEGQLKKLFSWQHASGILLFVTLVGSYYYFYQQYNSLDQVFSTLWSESSKRTVAETSVVKSGGHILSFPFQIIFHFLPFTLLVFFALNKKAIQVIRENSFLRACMLIFILNIGIYWLSPETRPRYLFMLLPMFFAIPVYMFSNAEAVNSRWVNIVNQGVFIITIILSLSTWLVLFIYPNEMINSWVLLKCTIISSVLAVLALYIWQNRNWAIYIFVSVLLMARIGFNLFVLPYRQIEIEEVQFKKDAIQLAAITGNKKLFLKSDVPIGPTESYYLSCEKKEIIRKIDSIPGPGSYMIIYPGSLEGSNRKYTKLYDFEARYQHTLLQLVRMDN